MDVPSQAIRTLMEIGVAAAGTGLYRQAMAIFEGIEAMRPDSEGPAIGAALIQLNLNQHEEAIKALREGALAKNPASLEARMLLGVAFKLAGRGSECDNVIKELRASGDAQAKAFADGLSAR
jgi:Flp pilus assembly protein TadD